MEISFVKTENKEGNPYFQIREDSGLTINFDYFLETDELWKGLSLDTFEFLLLENPYYYAESNVFELKLDEIDERLGFLIPINALLSNDGNFNKILYNYAFGAFWYLLSKIKKVRENSNKLSDYFRETLIVCALNKRTIQKQIPTFTFDSYLLSFYEKGYSIYINEPVKLVKGYDYESLISNRRTLHLKKCTNKTINDPFFKDLFIKYLPKEETALARFIIVYQAIEYLMSEICNTEIEQIINDFSARRINKNDYFDQVGQLGGERKQIRLIFDKINSNSIHLTNFERECNTLYDQINYSPQRNNIADLFYSFRNLVVHNYRDLLDFENQVISTIQQFELLVIHICKTITY